MGNLYFYAVDYQYIAHLQTAERQKRGFTRVPNMNYGQQRKQKFLCGIVLQISQTSYYVPVSSYKQQKPDNFLIYADNGGVTSSLRFNYMFPCPISCVQRFDYKSIVDSKYQSLVAQEWNYCNKHSKSIYRLAQRTYTRVIRNYDSILTKNSCDFLYLEQKCREYKRERQIQKPLSLDKQLTVAREQANQQNAGQMHSLQRSLREPEK